MTNYQSISTCACIGENLAIQEFQKFGRNLHLNSPASHVGPDSTWDQRRAFEWAYLGTAFRLCGDEVQESYCYERLGEIRNKQEDRS